MAEADCEFCQRCGLRTCDVCGGVSFEVTSPAGCDVCGRCRAAQVVRPRGVTTSRGLVAQKTRR